MYILNFEDISDTKASSSVGTGEAEGVNSNSVAAQQTQQQPGYKWKRGRSMDILLLLLLFSTYYSPPPAIYKDKWQASIDPIDSLKVCPLVNLQQA